MNASPDPDRVRAELLEGWENAAAGWGRSAWRIRANWMAMSSWLIDALELHPGQTVLELAAGPGDTGFMAAELVAPGGKLICSDAVEAMLDVARERARTLAIGNVEFKQLSLEWIDLPTAEVDAIVCRWGLMFAVDPDAALRECRRVLRPGGRIALAAWDAPEHNPWATLPRRALIELGHLEPEDPALPGMFRLADRAALADRLEDTGFFDVVVDAVEMPRTFAGQDDYLAETLVLSRIVSQAWQRMDEAEREAAAARLGELTAPFRSANGTITLPARSLAAAAGA